MIAIDFKLMKQEALDALGGCYRTGILPDSRNACTPIERKSGSPDHVPRNVYRHGRTTPLVNK